MPPTSTKETIQVRKQRRAALPRACEACKVRKVKCDRKSPCSGCIVAGITCQGANTGVQSHPRIDKVQQLQRQFELIDDRLRKLEGRSPSRSTTAEQSPFQHERPSPTQGTTSAFYEGQSSFLNQSIEVACAADNGATNSAAVTNSFSSLRALLEVPSETGAPRARPNSSASSSLRGCLAFEVIVIVLNCIKGMHSVRCQHRICS